jgi:hypothetical protein
MVRWGVIVAAVRTPRVMASSASRGRNAVDMRNAIRLMRAAALFACVSVMLAGCGGSSVATRSARPRASGASSAALVGYNPPVAFASGRGTPLPPAASENTSVDGNQAGPAPFALAGTTAFVATGTSLDAVDTRTGATLADTAPAYTVVHAPGQASGFVGNAATPPLVASIAGRQTAMVGYVVQVPGQGTTPPSLAIEIDLIDPSTGTRRSDVLAPIPGQPSDLVGIPLVTFAGGSGDDVVVSEGDTDDGYLSEGIDVRSGKLLWRNRAFLAGATVGGTAVGTLDSSAASDQGATGTLGPLRLTGVDINTGRILWLGPSQLFGVQVLPSDGHTALVAAGLWSSSGNVIAIVDMATGEIRYLPRSSGTPGGGSPWTCEFDGVSTDVCSADLYQGQAVAVDASTGRVLWQLPDRAQNRIAPNVTSAWHGAIYGTTPSGPVVLDARSGKDRNDSPGVAPVLLDAYVGVAVSPQGGLEAYPATR